MDFANKHRRGGEKRENSNMAAAHGLVLVYIILSQNVSSKHILVSELIGSEITQCRFKSLIGYNTAYWFQECTLADAPVDSVCKQGDKTN